MGTCFERAIAQGKPFLSLLMSSNLQRWKSSNVFPSVVLFRLNHCGCVLTTPQQGDGRGALGPPK
jgi:hypothetical protein